MSRIKNTFSDLKTANRAGLITFITAGDPDYETSLEILKGLPAAGADIIELGMPFSDPMADGPTIQDASQRALKAGMTLAKTLDLIREFRKQDDTTPVILMGYFNPILHNANDDIEVYLGDIKQAGVDGLLIVDMPPEEDGELCLPAQKAGLDFIRLVTPTTDDARLPVVLNRASGFVYYVSIAGITGTASAESASIENAVERLRGKTELPVAVGFGIRTAEDVAKVTAVADAAVVGSAIVSLIGEGKKPDEVLKFVKSLAQGILPGRTAQKTGS